MIDFDRIPMVELLARGKLSTLNREAREKRAKIRERMAACVAKAQTTVRLLGNENGPQPLEELAAIRALCDASYSDMTALLDLQPHIDQLAAEAWPPKGKK